MKQRMKQLISILLSLVMVLGLFPNMNMTALAYDNNPYADLVNTTTTVTFNGILWNIIEDNSSAVDEGTVTLLAADTSFGESVFDSNATSNNYNTSTVKAYLNNVISGTAGEGKPDFSNVSSAIENTDNGKLYLLDIYEANNVSVNIRKYTNYWWLRSPGYTNTFAAVVMPVQGYVGDHGASVPSTYSVRPALKLNLSSVIFSPETKTFSLKQTITVTDVTATYGDTGKKIEATTSGDGSLSYAVKSGDAVTVDNSGNLTIIKAGTAVVTVTAAETTTYAQATKDVNVNVNTKTMTVSAENVNVTVDGQPHGINVNVTDPTSGASVKYGTEEGSYTLDDSPTQTDIGTKTIYYQVTADNYTAYTGSATVTISEKATQTITASNVTTTYGDAGKKVSATTDGNGQISYAVKAGSEDYIDVNTTTGALTIKKAGTATIVVTASETDTYAQATREVTVSINKANAVAATVTSNNSTYDGTNKPLATVSGEAIGGSMQYTLGTATIATQPYTKSIPTATDAGTYYVWYKLVGDENHSDTEPVCVTSTIRGVLSRTVTFKVVNGSWNDETTENKSVTLAGAEGESLRLSADQIPAVGSKPSNGYKAGSWDNDPDTETVITNDMIYTYSYTEEVQEKNVVADVEIGDGAPQCSVDKLSEELYEEVTGEEEKEAVERWGDTLHLVLKVNNIDDTISESDKELAEIAVNDAEVTIGMFLDISLYKWLESSPSERTHISDLHGKNLRFFIDVPDEMKDRSSANRMFYVYRINDSGITLVAKTTKTKITVESDYFSVFVLAYSDTEDAEETSDDEMTEEEKRDLEYRKQHPNGQHTFVPKIVKDPTGEEDGLMINVCRYCGFVERDSEQNISGYGVFNAKTVTALQNEAASGTVQMETLRWISVHRNVLETLQAKTNVTLRLYYLYKGKHYVLEIHSDDPNLDLLLATVEDEYFGFRYLGTIFTSEEIQ